jgi:hypothetical protein
MSPSTLTWRERANWGLLIGGFVMLVVAVAFLVIAVTVSIVRVSFIVTGIIMALSGLFMLRLGWGNDEEKEDDDRIRASGVPGTATIESVQRTGNIVRHEPQIQMQLRLHVPGRPPYLITHREIVPREVAETLSAGTSLRTLSDPDDPLHIVVDWDGNAATKAEPGPSPSPISEPGSQTPFS